MNNWINLFLQEVLDKKRLELLPYFSYIKDMWFYLAGGTGLALQLGHRQSIDFDFFIKWNFDENQLFEELLKIFKSQAIKKIFSEKNTLYVEVGGVKISFFGYDYGLVKNLIETSYFNLASIEDIGAMKLWAIQKRATNKDYVDLYYILKKVWLNKLLEYFFMKYWNVVSEYLILKSLIYFDDIENDSLVLLDKWLDFEKVKNWLVEIVKEYEKFTS